MILANLWDASLADSRFNNNFPAGPGLVVTRMSPFWILLELRVMEVVVTTGANKTYRAAVKMSLQKKTSSFFTGGCPSCHPTHSVGALKGKIVCLVWRWKSCDYCECSVKAMPTPAKQWMTYWHRSVHWSHFTWPSLSQPCFPWPCEKTLELEGWDFYGLYALSHCLDTTVGALMENAVRFSVCFSDVVLGPNNVSLEFCIFLRPGTCLICWCYVISLLNGKYNKKMYWKVELIWSNV